MADAMSAVRKEKFASSIAHYASLEAVITIGIF